MKQVVGFVQDSQVMLEEIFSNTNLFFFHPEVNWTLLPIYDEYTEDGVLIVCNNQKFMSTIFDTKLINRLHEFMTYEKRLLKSINPQEKMLLVEKKNLETISDLGK